MKLLKLFTATILAVHVLAACGGGDSNDPGTRAASGQARITSDNAEQVAALVVETSGDAKDFGGMTSDLTGTGTTRSVNTRSLEVSARSLSSLFAGSAPAETEYVKAGPVTEQCPVSGSITIAADIADPNSETPSEGDSLSMTADRCESQDGMIDGGIRLVINGFSGDPSSYPFEFSATMNLDGLSVTEGSDVSFANGDMTITIGSEDGVTATSVLSGNRFTVSRNGESQSLSKFLFRRAFDTATRAYSSVSGGTVEGKGIDGAVSFTTPVPFRGTGDGHPHTGEMKITGADKASLRIIALDSLNVRIEVDADGDGNPETTIDTTWEAIDS